MPSKIFTLMGPTASGKTALACQLAERFPFEIISVDSAMIYRGMDIGTAKPSAEELARFPHHLIDIRDPDQSFSAAEFCTAAEKLCADIFSRNKIPLLVGGTMMYFRALEFGLANLPEASPQLRAELLKKADQIGWPAMHAELEKIDPITALKIHAHDSQRIQRALEVFYLTKKPLSQLLGVSRSDLSMGSDSIDNNEYRNLVLFPEDRAWLHTRIAKRFENMLEQGFLQEVEGLLQKWKLDTSFPAMRTVGYRQAYAYLQGNDDYNHFCNKAVAATRQLAKRQLTWLRHWPDAHYYDPASDVSAESLNHFIDKIVSKRS